MIILKKCNCPTFSLTMSKKLAVQCQCIKRAVKDLSRESIIFVDTIIDVKRIFLSECNLIKKYPLSSRNSESEPNIQYIADYDDLCGPWPSPDHPTFKQYNKIASRPMLCTWKFVTVQDMKYISQHLFDKNAIKFIIEQKLPNIFIFANKVKEIFLNLTWEIFKYMRDNNFSGKGISSILGLFYLTHCYFLSSSWCSANETYAFFKDGINLHAFLKPPESDMIFNFSEYDNLLDMFYSLYITKLNLIRSICIPKYNLIFKRKKCNIDNHEVTVE